MNSSSGSDSSTAGTTDDAGATGGDAATPGGDAATPGGDAATAATAAEQPEGLGRRGWVLVGVIVVSTLVVPGIIYLRPATPGAAGLPFLASMLALPILPALLLGAAALWSVAARGD